MRTVGELLEYAGMHMEHLLALNPALAEDNLELNCDTELRQLILPQFNTQPYMPDQLHAMQTQGWDFNHSRCLWIARKAQFGRNFSTSLVHKLTTANLSPCINHGHARTFEKDLKEVVFEAGMVDGCKTQKEFDHLTASQHSIREYIEQHLEVKVKVVRSTAGASANKADNLSTLVSYVFA